ncbi:DNA recombination protein RmuC [Sphingobacterium allocomposti]|uniref:DNA recombination protein RmuC n=2 Tax=Pseudomonadati TaxID=3379134 RepID=A0A5S5D5J5_9SPHI|nr:DNA recombination protein RmuC [Sphingobacterium composti Yoo et al. 2007 non Ten et al. 2007]TYP90042.1 DNA recombination protein RmuC [Sphingobacterium composti Yoo et al. 2007 non Ten et al. 2007]HLS96906.1 DNA recombination protein RmuC [Sphingobacterium sp.]
MEILFIIVIAVLLVVIIVLVRNNARGVSRAVLDEVTAERNAAQLDLARSLERERLLAEAKDDLSRSLEKERSERGALERTLESTNAFLQAQQEKFQVQQEEIVQMREQFHLEFQHIANRILDEKTEKFTAVNQRQMDQILTPLQEKIKTFEEKVERTYQQEAAERNVLKGVVEQLMQQSALIKNEANNLTRALKGDTKKQGNWGEIILERVLERSGLVKDQEYRLQSVFREDDLRKIPDAIILLPENKHLVVDAKVSLTAYERWVNEEDREQQLPLLRQHVQSIEGHVRELSSKNYQDLYGIHSPDFVLLFIPIESALSVAVKEKPDLFADAWDRRVVIVSPSTLLATLRTIASIWVQERQNRNVLEIAKEAGALYDKFVGFLTDMQQIDIYLKRAAEKHEDAMKKLSTGAGNVTRKIENLKALGAKANKQIDSRFLEE